MSGGQESLRPIDDSCSVSCASTHHVVFDLLSSQCDQSGDTWRCTDHHQPRSLSLVCTVHWGPSLPPPLPRPPYLLVFIFIKVNHIQYLKIPIVDKICYETQHCSNPSQLLPFPELITFISFTSSCCHLASWL